VILRCGILVLIFMAAQSTAIAQVTTGTIVGAVADPSGSGISGARVTITEVNKGTSQEVLTDDSGNYAVTFLIPGSYRVSVATSGFKTETATTELQVDQRARLDFKLQVGQVSETVEVSATAAQVRSESAELGEVISSHAVQELPLNGRNFATLVYLIPGVTSGQSGENLSGSSTFNPRAASDFNALGSQANANAWLVDGIVDNEYTFNTVMVQPSVGSVQEFKGLTGVYPAEFGRGAGVVTTQTKSGSNEIHGSVFWFLRNSALDARNYFNSIGQHQTPYNRNQFGATMGGPVIKNKLFIFGDYYGARELKGQTFINTVPTAQEHTGDFSDLLAINNIIYNPYSTQVVNGKTVRTPFAGNMVPSNLINQVGANVASLYPAPNQPGFQNNYISVLDRNLNDNGGNMRMDYKLSDKDSMFFRYSYEQFHLFDTRGQGGCCIPTPPGLPFTLGPFVAGGQFTTLIAQGAAFNETHVFSPTLVNQFIAGFARTNPLSTQSDYGINAATSLGVQGINISKFSSGLPTVNLGGIAGLNGYTSLNDGPAFLPANPRQTSYQLEDDVSWTRGKHSLKFGYRLVKDLVSPFSNTTTRSSLNFQNNLTSNPLTSTGGNGYAELLLGILANGTGAGGSRGYLQTPYYLTVYESAAFVQDDWKVNSRLTLNLGVRWDLFTPYTEERNRLTNFDLTNLTLVYAGVNGVSNTAGVQTRWNDVGPHIGFAYDLTGDGKTAIRGGFIMSYFPEQPSASNMLGQAIPWTISQNTATFENYPLDVSKLPTINSPFPTPVAKQPFTTADLIAANPLVLGGSFNNQTPYYETWSIGMERQITSSIVAEVGYAGSRGVHLLYCYNPQEVEPGPSSVPSALRVTIPTIATLRSITQCDQRNMSNYNSLQAKLSKRFSNGLQFLAAYTWSKSLDYGGSAASGGGAVGNPQTVTDLAAGYGPSGFNIPQRFIGSWVYQLPFGKGQKFVQNGVAGWLLGGWEFDGIALIQSGLPFSVNGLSSCTNNASTCWPDRIRSGKLSNPDYSHWYDPTAFQAPCAVPTVNGLCSQYALRFGDVGRGIFQAPGTHNFDLSMVKNFSIKERIQVQFRVDAFNTFNHPQLGFPNQTINAVNPAKTSTAITSTIADNRDLQLALKVLF
jgi:hypothetical protein